MNDISSLKYPKFARFTCRHCGKEFDINPLHFYPLHAYPCPHCGKVNDATNNTWNDKKKGSP